MKGKVRKLNEILTQRLSDSKTRAKNKKLPHNITRADIEVLYKQSGGRCPLSGVEFSMATYDKNSPSLDQIKAGKGYVRGNVWFIAEWVNKAKNDMDLEIFSSRVETLNTNLRRISE